MLLHKNLQKKVDNVESKKQEQNQYYPNLLLKSKTFWAGILAIPSILSPIDNLLAFSTKFSSVPCLALRFESSSKNNLVNNYLQADIII